MSRSSRQRVPNARPFLKWAGGKSRLIRKYEPYLPDVGEIGHYFEPFIGSAALFFHLQPVPACLSDCNHKLIEVFEVVRDDVEALIEALQSHKNEKAYYYEVRAQDPAGLSKVARAARIIYMNRTCYNGLYRENQKGEFNGPFGRYKNPTICDEERLQAASASLQGVTLWAGDFAEAVAAASSSSETSRSRRIPASQSSRTFSSRKTSPDSSAVTTPASASRRRSSSPSSAAPPASDSEACPPSARWGLSDVTPRSTGSRATSCGANAGV